MQILSRPRRNGGNTMQTHLLCQRLTFLSAPPSWCPHALPLCANSSKGIPHSIRNVYFFQIFIVKNLKQRKHESIMQPNMYICHPASLVNILPLCMISLCLYHRTIEKLRSLYESKNNQYNHNKKNTINGTREEQ